MPTSWWAGTPRVGVLGMPRRRRCVPGGGGGGGGGARVCAHLCAGMCAHICVHADVCVCARACVCVCARAHAHAHVCAREWGEGVRVRDWAPNDYKAIVLAEIMQALTWGGEGGLGGGPGFKVTLIDLLASRGEVPEQYPNAGV